jgi:hypothetical protein
MEAASGAGGTLMLAGSLPAGSNRVGTVTPAVMASSLKKNIHTQPWSRDGVTCAGGGGGRHMLTPQTLLGAAWEQGAGTVHTAESPVHNGRRPPNTHAHTHTHTCTHRNAHTVGSHRVVPYTYVVPYRAAAPRLGWNPTMALNLEEATKVGTTPQQKPATPTEVTPRLAR